ncbi:MAG: transcription initiation factor IIB family protein [Sulfolobaceae archaeon]|nr:transcription initiation factor IIB family protein [Sulfolobaceae archaeon]
MVSCPHCNSNNIIYDYERGTYVCADCGFVLEENVADLGPEWRAYTPQDRLERERTGSPLTPKVHDFGLTTKIGASRAKDKIKLLKLQRMQNSLRVSPRDRKLVTFLAELNNSCAKLGLPEHVKETASLILRKLVENGETRRINKDALLAAVIYYACKVEGVPKHLKEILQYHQAEMSEIWKATRKVQEVAKEEMRLLPKFRPTEYIPKIVEKLELPSYIISKASEIVETMYRTGLTSGKGYLALSAASVYIISTIMDYKKTQKEIADSLGLTEVTIRNRYREIIKSFDIEIKL